MKEQWNSAITQFISLANKHNVKMLMVDGGALAIFRRDLEISEAAIELLQILID